MSDTILFLTLFIVILASLTVQAHYAEDHNPENIKFYELKKGNLLVNLTNFGARIVSLSIPDKFGNVSDIVLGYDSFDANQDKYCFGAIVGRVGNRIDKFILDKSEDKLNHKDETKTLNGGRDGFSNAIWKVIKCDKSEESPSITFQYDSPSDGKGFHGNLIVTATYLLEAKNKLKLTLYAEAKDKATSLMNLAQNTYWNLGGHNSSGNILHDHDLRVLASNYRELNDNLVPTGTTLPVNSTPYDFQRYHAIQSKFQKLKNGYEVAYVLDQRNAKRDLKLAAVLRDKKVGRVLKVWTDQAVLQFSTGDEVRNVRGKGGVLYQPNSGLLLAPQTYPDSDNIDSFPSLVITKQKPYKQTTVFQFMIKKLR